MAQIGKFLLLLGLGSFALNLVDFEFRLLMWVDTWGVAIGHCIRGGMAALGAIFLLLASQSTGHTDESLQDFEAPARV